MIKVALVSHSSAFAGAEKMLYNAACVLKQDRNMEPIVFLPGKEDIKSDFFLACKAADIHTSWIGEYSGFYTWYLFDQFGGKSAANEKNILLAVEELKNKLYQYDIRAVVGNTATNLVAALSAFDLNIPVITWIHGIMDNTFLSLDFDAERRLINDRVLMALSTQVICCSNWTTNFYRNLSLAPIQTVYNWCQPIKGIHDCDNTVDKLSENENRERENRFRTFICLSTFEESKGVFVLLNAAKKMKELRKKEDWKLELYGDGSSEIKERIKEKIRNYGLEKHVFVKSRVIDVDTLYQKSFCLLQPSYIDSFGMTIVEAMMNGKPVIATRSGGPSEIIIDEETGYLIHRNDYAAMAEKMLMLIKHPEIAERMGIQGRKRYEEYFSENRAKQTFVPIIKETINRFCGTNPEMQLIRDFTIQQLSLTGYYKFPISTGSVELADELYDPDTLCFSSVIKQKRKYRVSGKKGSLSKIGILVADSLGSLNQGTVTLKVEQNKKEIGKAIVAGENLNTVGWSYFKIPRVEISDEPLTITICPEGFQGFGVFEVRNKRGFIYKLFNKLGHPLKGMNTLKVSLHP